MPYGPGTMTGMVERAIHKWRKGHNLVQRAGSAHASSRISSTTAGQLASRLHVVPASMTVCVLTRTHCCLHHQHIQ